jgi:hypothetical protein
MNNITKSLVACLLMAGIFNLSTVSARASVQAPLVSSTPKDVSNAPRIVAAGKPLSAQQLASYQQQSSASEASANKQAAGASSNTTVWIVVGVVVLVGVIALASGGGGGGGGGY